MSLTFYRAPFSTATVTELVIEELDVPHETVTLDLKKGEAKTAAHKAIDPNGRVPVIVHDGVSIWESAAITIYLGETFGTAKKLWPEAGPKRGEAMKWVVWANATLAASVLRWIKDKASAEMVSDLRVLDGALEGRAFLAGDYSLADTHLNSLVDWIAHMKFDLAPFPRVQAWSRRCADRPAYQRVMSRAG